MRPLTCELYPGMRYSRFGLNSAPLKQLSSEEQQTVIQQICLPRSTMCFQARHLVLMDTALIEAYFKACGRYIPPGGGGHNVKAGHYEHFVEKLPQLLQQRKVISAPKIRLLETNGGSVSSAEFDIILQDGRHRFSMLRDSGMTRIPVALTHKGLLLAHKHGLIDVESDLLDSSHGNPLTWSTNRQEEVLAEHG